MKQNLDQLTDEEITLETQEELNVKLWIYWMENDYSRHYEERELPDDGGDNRVDFEDASYKLNCMLNNGQIKDYQVELR